VPLYYTGLEGSARLRVEDGEERTVELDDDQQLTLELTVPAGGILRATLR